MTPAGMTVMLAVEPVDMRRSFDGLAALVTERMAQDPRAQRTMFVFINRQRTALKILWSDGRGLFILARRLDQHVVQLPSQIPDGARSIQVDARTLAALLEGVEPRRRETGRTVAAAARAAVENLKSSTRNHETPT